METKQKHPKREKSDQIPVWVLENSLTSSSLGKAYTCSFCKKGFSNAQALGGHMNIHRKDRAKLRESSEEDMLSLGNIKTINQNQPLDQDHSQVSEIILESSNSSPRRKVDMEELDLELRLGPEPYQETTSKNTRELFK